MKKVVKELCEDMAANPHVLTWTDIGVALATGAAAGQKSALPGGALIGATLKLSEEALTRAGTMLKKPPLHSPRFTSK